LWKLCQFSPPCLPVWVWIYRCPQNRYCHEHFIGSIFGFLAVVALGGSIFGLKVWYGTPQGRLVLDTIVLKLPVLGILMRKIAVARFTRTLGTLISAAYPSWKAWTSRKDGGKRGRQRACKR